MRSLTRFFRFSCPEGPRPGAAAALGAAAVAALLQGIVPLWMAAAAAVAALCCSRRCAVAFAIGGTLVGIGAGLDALRGTDSLARRFPEEVRRVDLRVRLIDPRLTGVSGVPQPNSVLAEAVAVSTPETGKWESASGRCLLRFADGSRIPPRGSLVEAEGILRRSSPREAVIHEVNGTVRRFTFASGSRRHLAARGADRTFTVDGFRTVRQSAPGAAGSFFRLRDALLRQMLRGVGSDRARAMIAAFFFGATGGLDAGLRNDFSASGTVHLFAVSGLHIGMLALLLGLLLRPLPYRLRNWVLPAAVWGYVLLTGANAPAIRAGFMVSLWCVCRASLRYIPTIDLLGGAAALMLALQPGLIGDTGFRYSVVITAALILLADRQREFRRLSDADAQLVASPIARRRLFAGRRWQRKLVEALIGCTAAFLAGIGISLAGQGEVLPGSIAANLLMLPLLPFFFLAGAIQLLSGGTCAALPAACFDLVAGAAGIFARFFSPLSAIRPGWAGVLLYCTGIFLWFGHPARRLRKVGAALALVLLVFWLAAPHFAAPKLLVISRSQRDPAAVAAVDPAHARAFVVDPPGGGAAAFLAETLRAEGVRQVETLYFDRPRLDRAAGAALLERRLPVLRRRLPAGIDRGAGRFLQELEERARREDAVSVGPGGESVEVVGSVPGNVRIAVADRLSGIRADLEVHDTDEGRKIVVRSGGAERSFTLPWSRELQVLEYPLR